MIAARLLLYLAAAWSAYAQAGLGTIQGNVTDTSGASIPNASVTLRQTTTNTERTTVSNDTGLFTFPSMVASQYTLNVSAPGFKAKTIENINLNAFQVLTIGAVALEIGDGPATTITVTSEQQIVKDNAVRYESIQSKQVTDMPLQGRNWSTLLKIIPGSSPRNQQGIVGREASYDGYADFRINGKNANQTQVNLDGGSIVDHGNDAKTTVAPSLESIQEVAVLTNNFQAEYGLRSGAVINVVTKSGSNQFHGTGWNYMRNEALNANTWSNNYFGLPRQRYRFNYFGANLGGPIKKDKLFFFYNYENLKQDTPTIQRQVRVPTELERQGDFSQTVNADGTRPTIFMPGTQAGGNPVRLENNIIPQNLRNPLGMAVLNLYPLPNLRNETNNNYLLQYARLNPRQTNVGKVDWNIDDKTRAYVRYSQDMGTIQDNIGWTASGDVPFAVTKLHRPDRALAVNLTRTFSPTLVSESLFSWSFDHPHSGLGDSLDPDKIDRTKVGLGALPSFFQTENGNILPQIDPGGVYPGFNFNRFPVFARANEWQYSSTWTWTRGAHIMKFGGMYIRNTKAEIDGSQEKGVFNFGVNTASDFDTGYSPANMVTGALNQFRQVSNIMQKNSLYQDVHFFAQDTWKITPRLTLDFGLRASHMPTEFNRYPDQTLDAVFLPSRWDPAKAPRLYVPDPNNRNLIIDPAFPNNPLPANVANALRFSIVPGSGDPLNGVVPLGGANGNSGLRNPPYLMFAPRGGFAWSFTPKTVLRGGFGWAYNRVSIGQAVNNFENGLAEIVDIRQTSLSALASSGTSGLSRISPRSFGVRDESSNKLPTVYDFSLSVQRELPWAMVFDLAYIGNLQRHQNVQFNINNVIPGTGYDARYVDPRVAGSNFAGPVSATNPGPLAGSNLLDNNLMRPFPGFENLNLTANVANAVYNSMQTSLSKRYGQGLTFQVVHTYGYLRTQVENVGHFFLNWKDYTGFVADQDRRHVLGVNYTYDVPSISRALHFSNPVSRGILDNWKIAHLMNFYSGRYASPGMNIQEANTTNNMSNLNAIFTGSPNYGPRIGTIGNPNNGGTDIGHMFDPTMFAVPGIGLGQGSRNFLRYPATHSNDINISKQFPLWKEDKNLELRVSMFNPFNVVRRDNVNSTATFKANGRNFSDGFRLFNTPEQQVANLLERRPNATPLEQYNQDRTGFGHVDLTNTLPMRIIEVGLRLRF
jgi:hypothetical protein